MNIAIVASGSSLLELKKGEEIDSHDIVIRMNDFFKLIDKSITGIKLDIWACCFNWGGYDITEPPGSYPSFSVWVTRPIEWDGERVTRENRKSIWCVPAEIRNKVSLSMTKQEYSNSEKLISALGGTNPTTGFNTIIMAQSAFPESKIDLYGYDCYEPNNLYYDTKECVFPVKHHHSPHIEKQILGQWDKEGKINWIRLPKTQS